jgi:hypothetical protein
MEKLIRLVYEHGLDSWSEWAEEACAELFGGKYNNHGISIQFHPNTTYESFVGGLAPARAQSDLGFRFEPVAPSA